MFEELFGNGIIAPEEQNQVEAPAYQEQERQPSSLESAFSGPDVGNPSKMLPAGGLAPGLPPQAGPMPTMPGAGVPMPPPPAAPPQQPGPGPGVPIPPAIMGGAPIGGDISTSPMGPIDQSMQLKRQSVPMPPPLMSGAPTPGAADANQQQAEAPMAPSGNGRTALPPLPGQKGYTGKPSSPSAGGSSGQPMLPADRVRQASESAGPKEMGPFGIDKARWRAFLSGMGRAMAESSQRGSFFHGLGSGLHYTLGAQDEADKSAGAAEDKKRKNAREDFADEHTNLTAAQKARELSLKEEKGVLDAAKEVDERRRKEKNDEILNRQRTAQTEETERKNADAKAGKTGGNREVNTGQYNSALDNYKTEEKAAHEAIDEDKTLTPQQKAQVKQEKSDELFRNQFGPFNEAAVRKSFGNERYDRAFAQKEKTGGSQNVGLTPEEARKLPPGTRFIGRDGQPYTR